MGRVRRYKKYKSCDPFAKGAGSDGSKSKDYDEPPDIYDDKEMKKIQRDERDWADQKRRDRLIERDALRMLKADADKANKQEKIKVEGKKDTETMAQFKSRLKQETRKTLIQEKISKSSTAIKRKLRLKERKLKRQGKLAKPNSDYDGWEEEIEITDANVLLGRKATEPIYLRRRKSNKPDKDDDEKVLTGVSKTTGFYRPDDGNDEVFLQQADIVRFGEVAERPPELHKFAHKLESKKRKKQEAAAVSSVEENEDYSDEENKPKQKKKALSEISTQVDDGDNPSAIAATPKTFASLEELKLKKKTSNSGNTNAQTMELVRMQAKLAYEALKNKRLAAKNVK